MKNFAFNNTYIVVFTLFMSIIVAASKTIQSLPKPIILMSITDYPNYETEWAAIEVLVQKGLYTSALDKVNELFTKASNEKNAPQIIKSFNYKMFLQRETQETQNFEIAVGLKEEIEKSDFPVKNILHSMLAQYYVSFYNDNRWQISQRTNLDDSSSNDINTWTEKDFTNNINQQFSASLMQSEKLKSVPVDDFEALLMPKNKVHRKYKPTVYDLLAWEALNYYSLVQEPGVRANAFELRREQEFGYAEAFKNIDYSHETDSNNKLRAMLLYQELTRFHNAQRPETALFVDYERLNWVFEQSVLENKSALYAQSLDNYYKRYEKYSMAAEFGYGLSRLKNEQNDKLAAKNICEAVIKKYATTGAANNCQMILNDILQKEIHLVTEKQIYPRDNFIGKIQTTNVSVVSLKAYAFADVVKAKFTAIDGDKIDLIRKFLKTQSPVLQQTINIPLPIDYKQHEVEIAINGLQVGKYLLVCETPQDDEILITNEINVVSWAIMNTQLNNKSIAYVVDSKTGAPQKGVSVTLNEYNYNGKREVAVVGRATTDADGKVSFDLVKNNYCWFEAKNEKQSVKSEKRYLYKERQDKPSKRVIFYTDRAIYRPGQKTYFKAVSINEKSQNYYATLAKTELEVAAFDQNNQKIWSKILITNAYGTISGEIELPQSIATGQVQIRCLTKDINGGTTIRVEEYKRPKFEITIDPINKEYTLGELVNVTGEGAYYAGPKVSNARVNYRVLRQTRFVGYDYWRMYVPAIPVEIASGSSTTNDEGKFNFEFKAIPQEDQANQDNAIFSYRVMVDVVDETGETRSAEYSFNIGNSSCIIEAICQPSYDLNQPAIMNLALKTINDQLMKGVVAIEILELEAPKNFYRERMWTIPDLQLYEKTKWEESLPLDEYNTATQNWPVTKTIYKDKVTLEPKQTQYELKALQSVLPGFYKATLTTTDKQGKTIKTEQIFTVTQLQKGLVPTKEALNVAVDKAMAQPGETIEITLNSILPETNVRLEVICNNVSLYSKWMKLNTKAQVVVIPVTEAMRGGIAITACGSSLNRMVNKQLEVTVPFTNKNLNINWQSYRDKLEPGKPEAWKATVTAANGEKINSEILASMYDQSLDQFYTTNWQTSFYNQTFNPVQYSLAYETSYATVYWRKLRQENYSKFEIENLNNWPYTGYSHNYLRKDQETRGGRANVKWKSMSARSVNLEEPVMVLGNNMDSDGVADEMDKEEALTKNTPGQGQMRTNLNETAFFLPNITANEKGEIVIEFNSPEALTKWKLRLFAHTPDFKTAYLQQEVVTQKELMVLPNIPRFMRAGDKVNLSAKITNLSEQQLNGEAKIIFFDALTGNALPVDVFGNVKTKLPFKLPSKGATLAEWLLEIPADFTGIVGYEISAKAGNFTDGEMGAVPVLTNQIQVIESLPLAVKSNEQKQFTLAKLDKSTSKTLRTQNIKLEFTPNPAWNAVLALPYLMEFPHECNEQIFHRYYANSLAAHVAKSNPLMAATFAKWQAKSPNTFDSPLSKNQDIKNIVLNESPWLQEAETQTQRRQSVSQLFNTKILAQGLNDAQRKLLKAQKNDGSFGWFNDMPSNVYITTIIVSGFGHLSKLGVEHDASMNRMLKTAVVFLDKSMANDFDQMKRNNKDYKRVKINYAQVNYFYARSFFNNQELDKAAHEAVEFYKPQLKNIWTQMNPMAQAMIALVLHRDGDAATARLIMKSLKERALSNDEIGKYYRLQSGYYWNESAISTQSLIIEAFGEINNDVAMVEDLKLWLLKNKQTSDWKTTIATADACYALLLAGNEWLAQNDVVLSFVNNTNATQELRNINSNEAGTGYYALNWNQPAAAQSFAQIKVENKGKSPTWGAMYWTYIEDMDKVTEANTALYLNKKLYKQSITAAGPLLTEIKNGDKVSIGDKVVVRLILKTDRALEYVYLKDLRASGFEPISVLSGYRYKNGLGYYESTRDVSTGFFIDYMPKGTYVFEYELRAFSKGNFGAGIASIECMYAPEFKSHSNAQRVQIGQ